MFVLYVLDGCPYCERAIEILRREKCKYEKIVVSRNENEKMIYKRNFGMETFPMIFVSSSDNQHYIRVGGSSDLETYIEKSKELGNSTFSMDILYSVYSQLFNK